jgi:hypothetical protein
MEAMNKEMDQRVKIAEATIQLEIKALEDLKEQSTDQGTKDQVDVLLIAKKQEREERFHNEVTAMYNERMEAQTGPGAVKRIEALAQKEIEILNKETAEKVAVIDQELEEAQTNYEASHEAQQAKEERIIAKKANAIKALAATVIEINKKEAEEIDRSNRETYAKIAGYIQEFVNQTSQAVNSIAAIWNSYLDNKQAEELAALDEEAAADQERLKRGEIDAEEYYRLQDGRAAKEKEINKVIAQERHKADLFQWGANIAMATAQAAMAVLNALATGGVFAVPLSIIAGALGALQVAAVVAAKPQPPRFHSGGVVEGPPGQEVPAVLRAGEVVSTQAQFRDTMRAISQLSHAPAGSGSLQVKVENNAARVAAVENPRFDGDMLRLTIREVVNAEMSGGRLNSGFAGKDRYDQGKAIETW